ncbi:dipeptidase PepE [Paraferrimonas sp. SM1919]|uniref:dipeptidase PepE n=1 Tax=Paraferrimonas sp. SM1919 TaxID=2662263 RepID=UPI0013D2C6A3|nr:dipeptidase PepE [Paraferrimonas sp. SM1919]
MSHNLLLLSTAKCNGQPYLQQAIEPLKQFTVTRKKWLFIPYAAIKFNEQQYHSIVINALQCLDINILSINQYQCPKQAIEQAEGIIVGGGNSFRLLKLLKEQNLLEPIRAKVRSGTPYLGWSAGAVIAGPSIQTTVDMPIVQVDSFDSLKLVDFFVHTHFEPLAIKTKLANTLKEFYRFNQDATILALQNCNLLLVKENKIRIIGPKPAYLFNRSLERAPLSPEQDLSIL